MLIAIFSISNFPDVFSENYFQLIDEISTNSWSIGLELSENKIFVADGINNNIMIFDEIGKNIKKITLKDDDSCIGHIHGITVYENRLYVVKENNDCVGIYNFDGDVIKVFGSTGYEEGEFNSPQNIESFNEKIYVTDNLNKRIQIFDLEGNFLNSLNIQKNMLNEDLLTPYDLEIYQEKIYITLPKANVIQIYDIKGNFLNSLNSNENFMDPLGITIKEDMIFVASGDNNEIVILNLDGDLLKKINSNFKDPHQAFFLENKLYVLDTRNFALKIFLITETFEDGLKTEMENKQESHIYLSILITIIILISIFIFIKRYYINKIK